MLNIDKQNLLRQRREELGLSQGDLALRLKARGVPLSRKAISEWERGKRQVWLEKPALDALADALRWSLTDLMNAVATSGSTHD